MKIIAIGVIFSELSQDQIIMVAIVMLPIISIVAVIHIALTIRLKTGIGVRSINEIL